MNDHKTWLDLAAIIILALPGVIAAVSSLRNGTELKKMNGSKSAPAVSKKKPTNKQDDWFEPPKFD